MRKISYSDYLDKVGGGWVGKCAGGIVGAKQENNKSLMDYTFGNVFPDKYPPNDDFDLQILYLQEVLEKRGFDFSEIDLAKAFAEYNMCWANEYRIAIRNVNLSIWPPKSGEFNNDFFQNSMGCPIRSELWGFVSIGNPALAKRFVDMDGCIDHSIESIEMEKYLAAVESMAFFETDLEKMLLGGLGYIEPASRVAEVIRFVFDCRENCPDYRTTREKLIARFGSSDASYAVVNMGIIVLALLYGDGDFGKTMLYAVNCGYDTDCTSATAGSILGIIRGKRALPAEWVEKVGEEFIVGTVQLVRERNNLTALAEDTAKLACAAIRDGINTECEITGLPEGFASEIPERKPRVRLGVRYESVPAVSETRECVFFVTVENEHDCEKRGTLSFSSEDLILDKKSENLVIEGNGKREVRVAVKVRSAETYQNGMTVSARFECGKEIEQLFVGVQCEAKYKIVGPFFDNYDTKKFDSDIHGGKMPKDLFDMFNNHVNIDREYVKEDFSDLDEQVSQVMYTSFDKLPLDPYITYKGSCCVYLVRDIWCEEEESVHMFCGHTSPFKAFHDGKPVLWADSFVAWMPLNNVAEIKLKKGRNRFVFKLTRLNGAFEFSVFFSKLLFGNGVLVDYREER